MPLSGGPADAAGRAAVRRATANEARVDHQPAFVLHSYPWRETSLIIEVLSRDFGRMALVARGAKRPTSQFRGILMPFSPLALSWSGRSELKSLVRAEWQGGLVPLRGEGLLAAFYLNELLVRLLLRADAHPALFASYVQSLAALAGRDGGREPVLRCFELDLLRDLGVAPSFQSCSDGEPIDPDQWYCVDLQRGLQRSADTSEPDRLRGSTVLALARRDLSDPATLEAAQPMLRRLIGYHLEGKPLNARRVLMDLRAL
ncbi:MAG TPA: DNA repair protein RecO [Burkholderiaceae bacterium]|jgi:DNA repair protein RecO (recombination protein O)|nr:DNA repair protein RecO [Burkholderiaceae bacterium]